MPFMPESWTDEQRINDDWELTAEEFDCDACEEDYHTDLLGHLGFRHPDDGLATMLCINCARLPGLRHLDRWPIMADGQMRRQA